jgi:hypothetical protein
MITPEYCTTLLCGTSLSFVRFASHVWAGAAEEQGTSG